MAAAPAAEPQVRTAEHFPRVLKPCRAVAAPFFECFSEGTKDPLANPRQALAACADLMKEYDSCMTKNLKDTSLIMYRVPEVYRADA